MEYLENFYALYYAIYGKQRDIGVTVTQALSEFKLVKKVEDGEVKSVRGKDKKERAGRRRFYITEGLVAEINKLYNSGLNMSETAEALGIAITSVHAHLENPRGRGHHQTLAYKKLREGLNL